MCSQDFDEDTGMRIARHPGGQDIPMQFAGKDATQYWNDIHGHVKFDILEDLSAGEGFNTGLDVLPVIMGMTVGAPPPGAVVEGGLPATQKEAYTEVVTDSLEAEGADAAAILAEILADIEPDSEEMRALGAMLGCKHTRNLPLRAIDRPVSDRLLAIPAFTADAAAQPCHWNYAQSVYQQELKNRGKWDECEFMNPSLNAFYRIPCGTSTCYCDQAFVIMESLAAEGCVDPDDIGEKQLTSHTFSLTFR